MKPSMIARLRAKHQTPQTATPVLAAPPRGPISRGPTQTPVQQEMPTPVAAVVKKDYPTAPVTPGLVPLHILVGTTQKWAWWAGTRFVKAHRELKGRTPPKIAVELTLRDGTTATVECCGYKPDDKDSLVECAARIRKEEKILRRAVRADRLARKVAAAAAAKTRG